MINIMQAIQELRPGAQCRIYGDTYSGIIWDDKNQTIPTEDEVNTKIAELQANEPMKVLREVRNKLLSETDWTQLKDVNLDIIRERDWKNYRQALRDLPRTSNPKLDSGGNLDMTSVVWPDKPSS